MAHWMITTPASESNCHLGLCLCSGMKWCVSVCSVPSVNFAAETDNQRCLIPFGIKFVVDPSLFCVVSSGCGQPSLTS